MHRLHIVVPVYNERETLERCLRRVVEAELPDGLARRIWLVDDRSANDAYTEAQAVETRLRAEGHDVSMRRHEVNRGKGATVQTAFDAILGEAVDDDLVIIQDADLEYDPDDYASLVAPILAGETSAVIGNRWSRVSPPRSMKYRVHALGNGVLTALSNAMTGYRVHDMECCYKVLTIPVLRRLRPMLSESRFGIEPQMVAGLARLRETLIEVPIRYRPRGFDAGKKIGWTDGVRALWVIARERFRGAPRAARPRGDSGELQP